MSKFALALCFAVLTSTAWGAVTYGAECALQSPAQGATIHTFGLPTASVGFSSSTAKVYIEGAQASQQFNVDWSLQLENDSNILSGYDWGTSQIVTANAQGYWERTANLSAQDIVPPGNHTATVFVSLTDNGASQGDTAQDDHNYSVVNP